jgi:Transposase DDE domain
VSVGVVALDGSLVAGDASPAANRTYASIREEVEQILGQAAEVDAAEDERFGQARGGELSPELADRRSRLERLRRCREELEAEQAAAQARYEENLGWRAEWEAEHGRKLGGRKPFPPDPDALAERKINTTDPDSRLIARRGGTVQGYNVRVVASPEQVILATEVTRARNDGSQLAPMVSQTEQALAAAGVGAPIGMVLADGAYWNSPAISAVRERGINVLIPTKNRTRTTPRTLGPRQGKEAQRIEAVLETPERRALYRRRQQIVEPVFAHTKFLRRMHRFQRRGLAACRAEWQLIAATHNLLKRWRGGLATAPA